MAEVDGVFFAAKQDTPQAQPHTAPFMQQDTPSDPSSSSNSTTMTGSQAHARSNSSYSDVSPPGEESKYTSADSNAPSPTQELRSVSPPPPNRSRARSSSSGGMLARLTSRSSSYISDHLVDTGSTITSHASVDSISKPRLDRAALAKPRGKYKSGVNWDSSPMNLTAGEEPFMEQISPSVERSREEVEDSQRNAELEEMAAAGSTKAALAWSRANSFGDPIFTNHKRAMAEATAKAAAPSGSSTPSSGSVRMKSASSSRLAVENGRSSNLRFNSSDMNGISEDIASKSEGNSREGSQSMHGYDLIAGVAQQVLESARRAAADSQDAQETQPSKDVAAPRSPDTNAEEAAKAAKLVKRRTFLGFGGGKKEKKKKDSVVPEEADDEGEEGPTLAEGQVMREDEEKPINGGTGNRRRRFNDTRQLNLLASELAAEALMGSPDSYPARMPDARRASMMSMLAATNGDLGGTPSNTSSQVSLQQSGLNNLSMPQPAFVNDSYRSGSPAGGSSRSGSPRIMGSESPRFDPPRAPFARSQQSLTTPVAALASQKAKLTGLPADMLTGLGDGPYPTLPLRGTEMSDPYNMPMSSEGAYEQPYLGGGGRNSLPDSYGSRSRVGSASSAPLTKRSVLQMSMYSPDSELQGLTKPPKSSRSTPFGSRAPSKQVTPHASFNNLREKANAAVSPTLLSRELAKSGAIANESLQVERAMEEGKVDVHSGVTKDNADAVNVESKNKSVTTAKKVDQEKERPAMKEARRSLFGKKSKSKLGVTGSEGNKNALLAPPPLPASTSKAQSLHSTNNGLSGFGSISNRLRAASRSAHSLVKVPSPTQSNATTSASSHDRGAFNYSSDGGSQQQGLSAVTTPEALPAKLELTSMPPPSSTITAPIASGSSPALPLPGASLKPNGPSSVSSTPRSMSATSRSSTNTIGRMNKFKSMFASRPSSASPKIPTATANPQRLPNGNDEKATVLVSSPLSNGSPSPNGEGTTRGKQIKYFHNKLNGKTFA